MPETYVVAVRRDQRDAVPDDWVDRLGATEGISVVGSSYGRAQIVATKASLVKVREELGEFLHIEPVIPHYPSDPILPPDAVDL